MNISFRKTMTAAAALLAIAGASGAAFADTAVSMPSVTIYGRLDMALEANTDGTTNRTAIQNFASRLGFKGEKPFNADLKGIFQLETGVAPDDGKAQSAALASRNSFVGLSSASMGSLIVGTNDMPLKSMEGTAYSLWGEGDLQELIIHGKGTWNTYAQSTAFGNVHTRKTNVLIYSSPKFADTVAKLAYSPDEAAPAATATAPAYSQPMVGASLYWDNGVFNAGYAYQSQDNFSKPTTTPLVSGYAMTASKMVIGAKMDAWTAGMALSTIDNNNGKKTNNWMVTGTYALGQTTLKASYGASSESSSGAGDDLTATSLEADYAMDKDFTVYTYYTQVNNGSKAKSAFYAADNFPGQTATAASLPAAGSSPHALGFGIRYNF